MAEWVSEMLRAPRGRRFGSSATETGRVGAERRSQMPPISASGQALDQVLHKARLVIPSFQAEQVTEVQGGH